MLELHTDDRNFSREKEVMCMIPKLPLNVEMQSICLDLGISRERLLAILEKLQKKYRISYLPAGDDMAVGSPRLSWARIQEDAQKYYDKVYNGKANNGI